MYIQVYYYIQYYMYSYIMRKLINITKEISAQEKNKNKNHDRANSFHFDCIWSISVHKVSCMISHR